MSRISKLMKGQGFTKTFPSIYIQSMINRFLVMEFINFISEWFLKKQNKQKNNNKKQKQKKQQKLTLSSKRGNLQSSILLILSTAAPIITQTRVL